MAGVKGRSGGHNRKNLAELKQTGGFRKDRHAHLLAAVPPRSQAATAPALVGMTSSQPDALPAEVLDGLGAAGQRFATASWREYEGWSGAELTLLRQAARLLDDAEAATDEKARRLAVRAFAAVVGQMGLGRKG
jgi:hypothetical protein